MNTSKEIKSNHVSEASEKKHKIPSLKLSQKITGSDFVREGRDP